MLNRKRILRVTSVLCVALAAGQVVETLRPTAAAGGSNGEPLIALDSATPPASDIGTGLPKLTGITPIAAASNEHGLAGCKVTLQLAPAPGAMIDLSMSAPCRRGERVVIRHSGLSFTALMTADGSLALQLPALEVDAMVAAYFDDAGIALARVEVPEATAYDRFAVQMAFPARFDLRADEGEQVANGSSNAPAESGLRRIDPLGTAKVSQPLLAQVYTLPAGSADTPDLTVELQITPQTCGQTLPLEALLTRNGKVTVSKLSVSVPLCGTSGDILLLKNLLHDLTLAAPN